MSHLGEKLNSIKGRPIRCFTGQLKTTDIDLQPDTLNIINKCVLSNYSNRIYRSGSAYELRVTTATHHKQQLLGPLHMFQKLVAHALV